MSLLFTGNNLVGRFHSSDRGIAEMNTLEHRWQRRSRVSSRGVSLLRMHFVATEKVKGSDVFITAAL